MLPGPTGQPTRPEASRTEQSPQQIRDGHPPGSPRCSGHSSQTGAPAAIPAAHSCAAHTTDIQPHARPVAAQVLRAASAASSAPAAASPQPPTPDVWQVRPSPCPSPPPAGRRGQVHLQPLAGHGSCSHCGADTAPQDTFPDGSIPPRARHRVPAQSGKPPLLACAPHEGHRRRPRSSCPRPRVLRHAGHRPGPSERPGVFRCPALRERSRDYPARHALGQRAAPGRTARAHGPGTSSAPADGASRQRQIAAGLSFACCDALVRRQKQTRLLDHLFCKSELTAWISPRGTDVPGTGLCARALGGAREPSRSRQARPPAQGRFSLRAPHRPLRLLSLVSNSCFSGLQRSM